MLFSTPFTTQVLSIRTLTSAAATANLSLGLLYFLLRGSRSRCLSAKSSANHCSILLRRCAEASSLRNGKAVHAKLIRADAPFTLFLHNHLLNAYVKCGDIQSAIQLFDEMPDKNVVSWTLLIMGYFQHGCPEDALSQFNRMRGEGVKPNEFTFSCALQLCSFSQASCLASQQIYSLIVRSGFESNAFLLNAFLADLIRHGKLADALEAFDKCLYKDTVSWNTMMAGYSQLSNSELPGLWCRMNQEGVKPDNFTFASVLTGLAALSELKLGVQVHARLVKSGHGSEMCVGNSLVDMYFKNQSYNDGCRAFEEIPAKDVWSWTQMAAGCINCGKPMEALEVIGEMRKIGMKPNKFTLATALNACASLASLQEGERVHGWRIKLGDDIDICVDNALLDMYVKCGCMNGALAVFRSMDDRSVVTWTSMIMGYAQNGYAKKALEIFEEMMQEGTQPNHVTFMSVLYACSQGGFVDEGLKYFSSMTQDYGLFPGEDHYVCMVDLLGRAGRVTEAEELISRMPFQAGLLVWKTLLGACWVHGDAVTAFRAAKHALDLDDKDPLTYVLVSNTLAGLSNWDDVGSMRKLMEDKDLKKMPASSWIEVDGDRSLPAVVDG